MFCDTGHTGDYEAMVNHLDQTNPNSYIVCVGFSLGGNIVTKYMGEKDGKILKNIIGGISICQGYNAVEYVYNILMIKVMTLITTFFTLICFLCFISGALNF